ncbi:MAG: sensor histidine kinase [Candidatus Hydrogenedentes bacterium]|nr:sensor histidine kinase [Candidatus Hydrogenedentota bacterium]
MLILSVVPLLIMASQGYHCGKQAIVEKTNDHLLSIMTSRSALVSTWFDQRFSELDVVASSPSVARCCAHYLDLSEEKIDQEVTAMLRSVLNRVNAYDEIAVLGRDGTVISDVTRDSAATIPEKAAVFIETVKNADGFQMQTPLLETDGNVVMRIGRRIREGGAHAGMILAKLNLTKGLDPLLQSRDGMGQTGKVYLTWLGGSAHISQKPQAPEIMTEPFADGERVALRVAPTMSVAHQDRDTTAAKLSYTDYRGREVWARASVVAPHDIALVVEQDTSEALAWLHRLIVRVVLTGTVTIVVIVIVAMWTSRRLGEPLRVLARVAHQVRAGATDERIGPMHSAEADEVRKAFNQMLDELAAKQRELVRTATLATVGELSSSIVHEMRNPLSSIKMNLQSLKREVEPNPANRELAEIADEQARRLDRMLDDLLQYGRPIEVRLEPVGFDDLLKSVAPVVADLARSRQVAIKPQDELLGVKLMLDPEQMCRVMTNLLVNAIQATPSGGTVIVRARKDALSGNTGSIDVIDSGAGLSGEAKERVFSPFFTTKESGTGLGLANVKKIVELHGGVVTAANATGGGAVFSIRLPLAQGIAA